MEKEALEKPLPNSGLELFAASMQRPDEEKAKKRMVDCVFYSGATVQRYDYWTGDKYFLKLSLDPAHVRMDRLKKGAPFLDSHSNYSVRTQLGVVEDPRIEDGSAKATIRFSKKPEVEPIYQDVVDGIIRNVSVGAQIHKLQDVTPDEDKVKTYLAIDWEPVEISAVSVPADPGAGFLSAQLGRIDLSGVPIVPRERDANAEDRADARIQPKEAQMPESTKVELSGSAQQPPVPPVPIDVKAVADQAVAAERTRIRQIRLACDTAAKYCTGIDETFCLSLVDGGATVEAAREKIQEKMAAGEPTATTAGAAHIRGTRIEFGRDERITRRDMMMSSLIMRWDPGRIERYGFKPDMRDYIGYSLVEMARECLMNAGIADSRKWARDRVVSEAFAQHSTSDFPNILADVARKTLLAAYTESERTYVRLGRRGTLPDFKAMNRVRLGEAPTLEKVNESGEIRYGTVTDGKEQIRLASYGKIIGITRQAIINDDLSAFTRIPEAFGSASARLEGDLFWAVVTANAALADGVALFHANHANLAGAGAVISATSIGAARTAMRTQKGLDKSTLIQAVPRFLVGPAALETTMEQFVATNILPNQQTAVIPETLRSLTPISEPRLDANSATAWYLFARPGENGVETIEYAYLEGRDGPVIEDRAGWNIDGVEIKVTHDFGVKALDHRGMYKNPGA